MNNLRLKKRGLSQEDLFNFSELFKLMKPRVMSLVIFTCAVGLLTSPNLISTKDEEIKPGDVLIVAATNEHLGKISEIASHLEPTSSDRHIHRNVS